MSRRRTIIVIILTFTTVALVAIVVFAAGILFLRSSENDVGVTAVTAVGVPIGPVTKKIFGPLGGSIASSDGRMTVTVPPNDLSEPVEFAITPITNTAPGGLGNAYRFGPDGQKFPTPVEISFKYTEQELEGTLPDALMAGYQEKAGGWRALTNERVDEAGKTLTVPTTHFTDMSMGRKYSSSSADWHDPSTHTIESLVATHFRISPAKATIRPGESVRLDFIGCETETGVMAWTERLLRRWDLESDQARCYLNGVGYVWNLYYVRQGFGSVSPRFGARVLYTAPSKKPFPNVVKVECHVQFNFGNKFPPPRAPNPNQVPGFWLYDVRLDPAEITIVDSGYRVSGNAGSDTVFSGIICDINEPFKLMTNNPFLGSFDFVPSSPTSGTWGFATKYGVTGGGKGDYTVEESDTQKTGIKLAGRSTASVPYATGTGSGEIHLVLTPLTGNECSGN